MHNDLVELGWTEEHWNRIMGAVTEEAQRARVAAQMLPLVGPEDPSTIAVPPFRLIRNQHNPANPPPHRLAVNSTPDLFLTTIAVNLHLRSHEMADPSLKAALGMFRRAANYVARIEDCLVFNGRPAPKDEEPAPFPPHVPEVIRNVATVTGDGKKALQGLVVAGALHQPIEKVDDPHLVGQRVVDAIVRAIGQLDDAGQQAPYACALSQELFAAICDPSQALILPRDRILPFLQGPLLRASAIEGNQGVVVSLSASSLELVVASDLSIRYLQTTLEPRYVFRICERIAVRIRDPQAICRLH
jgi:uncharacterized linocin/CFP29 family protein